MDKNASIFLTQHSDTKDLSYKVSYTNIIEAIPEDKVTKRLFGWEKIFNKEYRWRILEFNNKKVAEISYMNCNGPRVYFTKEGEWGTRDVPCIYDSYVIEEFFYYTK